MKLHELKPAPGSTPCVWSCMGSGLGKTAAGTTRREKLFRGGMSGFEGDDAL